MTFTLTQAMELQQQNEPNKAMVLYHEILEKDPQNSDALHGLGLCFAQIKNVSQSIHYLKKAVDIAPSIPAFHNNLGNAYKKAQQFEQAIMHYFEALKLKSPYPEVHNNLGGLYYQQGKLTDAILQFEKSIRMQPERADTHYNLANCYVQNNRLLEAIPHFKKVIEQKPNHLGAMHNLAIALSALKQFQEAYPLLKEVLKHDPNNIDILFQLGIIESSIGNLEAAKEAYLHILTLNPSHSDTHHNLATVYLHDKNKELALNHYEKAFELNAFNATAQHMIHALTGVATPQGAPPEYVAALFDQYAYSYNSHVTQQLNYQAPLLLREAIGPFASKLFKILDLGCGTGLCAPYFMDIADKITGVDLSSNMLEVAKAQGGYHKLIRADIHYYLEEIAEKNAFNLIMASDVFVYFADLKSVLEKCLPILEEEGLLLFSIENNETSSDYELQPSGRYRHNPQSVIAIASSLGLHLKHDQQAILRHENTLPVKGSIFIFSK